MIIEIDTVRNKYAAFCNAMNFRGNFSQAGGVAHHSSIYPRKRGYEIRNVTTGVYQGGKFIGNAAPFHTEYRNFGNLVSLDPAPRRLNIYYGKWIVQCPFDIYPKLLRNIHCAVQAACQSPECYRPTWVY